MKAVDDRGGCRHLFAVALWTLLLTAQGRAQPSPPPHRYAIEASVDMQTHRVRGRLRLTFVNTSRASLSALLFHLYPNAFEHDATVFMREGGRSIRGHNLTQPGYLRIDALSIDGRSLLDALDDELIPKDHTQARLPLATPLSPGSSLELVIDFETQLPRIVARMGHAGDFHMLAQWFPKLAKLEPDGSFAGFPYHGLGEFYADYAVYEVQLDVPADSVSGCGGIRLSRQTGSHRRRVERYRLSPAHDIACVVARKAVVHAHRAGPVTVEFFAPPGYDAAVRRQLSVVRDGLTFFGRHFGPYPYADLRVVIPPRAAHGASGMEYPGLIVTGGPWWSLPVGGFDPFHDILTAHELAHQWFYGLVASDEVTHPFLDEGLTEWSTWTLLQWRAEQVGAALSPQWIVEGLGALALDGDTPSSLLPAAAYEPSQLGQSVYLRPALALSRLSERHGQARVLAALGRYARAFRFRHPTPDDLLATIDAVLGAGESRSFLEPRLAGPLAPTLADGEPAADTDVSAARGAWLDSLIFIAQATLGWLGP